MESCDGDSHLPDSNIGVTLGLMEMLHLRPMLLEIDQPVSHRFFSKID